MTKSTDRLEQFIEQITRDLAVCRDRGMAPPIVWRLLRTVAAECGTKVQAGFLSKLRLQLEAAGLHTEPMLSSPALRRGDRIRFSTEPFPPDEPLFPRERDLQTFVQACLGLGVVPFRGLRLYQEGRKTLGREFRLPDGRRVDLLCEERTRSGHGELVVIEVKRENQKGTVEQMTGYLKALQRRFKRSTRGIIITAHEDEAATSSLEGARAGGYRIDWYCYRVDFTPFHPAPETAVSPQGPSRHVSS